CFTTYPLSRPSSRAPSDHCSFPTRRSSDLESVHTYANTINTHEGGTHEEGFRGSLTSLVNRYARDKQLLRDKDDNLTGEVIVFIDRKSTRLNSSHVSISYAVFCLKTK